MSAFVVGRTHIAYLVAAAMSRRLNPCGGSFTWWHASERKHYTLNAGATGYPGARTNIESPEAVGQMLWSENILSVLGRYPQCDTETMPGPGDDETFDYHEHVTPRIGYETRIDPAQVWQAVRCLAYQSCEHAGWETSNAKAFCDALEQAASALVKQAETRRGKDFRYQWEIRDEVTAVRS